MKEIILLLASDPAVRGVICNALESKGYCVLSASGIDEAAKWLKQYTPDLLMVRPYTEGMSGHDAGVFLRRIRPGIPVLIVGGIPVDVGLENREALMNFEIFPKPFTAAELLDKVKEVLTASALRAAPAPGSE